MADGVSVELRGEIARLVMRSIERDLDAHPRMLQAERAQLGEVSACLQFVALIHRAAEARKAREMAA